MALELKLEDQAGIVRRLLSEYVRSPSLRHIRDSYALARLASEIVGKLNRGSSAWLKWSASREEVVKAAAPCWLPVQSLADHLNAMPGPRLTVTDVAQRIRSLQEQDKAEYPNENVREICEALFLREQAEGTEIPAIIGAAREVIEREEERIRTEWQTRYKAEQEAKRSALEDRFRSGADCKWTPLAGSKELVCRINGRAYRLQPSSGGQVELYRIDVPDEPGIFVGRYRHRRDASKALETVSYALDLRR